MRQKLAALFVSLAVFASRHANGQVQILSGAQEAVFVNASSSCLEAFNTSLNCDASVQYLSYDLSYLNWQAENLTSLCTEQCRSSLQSLESAVSTACGDWTFEFNGGQMAASQIADLYIWKYDMSCLADPNNGNFCYLEEQTWNVTALNVSGQATWPTHTNVTYPDYDPSVGDFQYLQTLEEYGLKGKDYFVDVDAEPSDNGNYGWPEYLGYSEFPLEIQCSFCFLESIKLGINSQWGEVYDTVMEQSWSNIQQNCDITDTLNPANDVTAEYVSPGTLIWSTQVCPQQIETTNTTTCYNLAVANNVASASIASLNYPIGCDAVGEDAYCADESCQIAVVEQATSARAFLASSTIYQNITLTQFLSWNPYLDMYNMQKGEVVCIGAPGGDYIPPATTVAAANPSVFTTPASAPAPTPSGTTAQCGKYYVVAKGDYCNLIAQANSLTLDDFYALNPSLDDCCSNLLLSEAYCVAGLQGASATSLATTSACSYYTSTSVTSSIQSTTATATKHATAAAPTQTRAGSSTACYEWYTVQSGDNCYAIEQKYRITFEQFRAWNTDVDEDCNGLWADYAYCVSGPTS